MTVLKKVQFDDRRAICRRNCNMQIETAINMQIGIATCRWKLRLCLRSRPVYATLLISDTSTQYTIQFLCSGISPQVSDKNLKNGGEMPLREF